MNCGARALALETLEDDGEDLAAIGRVLGSKGSLLLWSCQTAAGERGTAFVDALARATGVEVSAAAGLVGAAALGGQWELDTRGRASEARAPLTADGMADYAGVMATQTWTGGATTSNPSSGNWGTSGNWSGGLPGTNDDVILGGTVAGDYTVTINTAAVVNVLDSLTINFTAGAATLGIGSRTLSVNGNGAGATQTVSVGATDIITIAGGTLNTGTLSLATSSSVTGSGTLNISGHYTGTGRLFASGGTLDVFGTVDSGVSLQINTTNNSTLKLEGTATSAAAISITSANQTLEVGTSGSLTINAAQTVTNGRILLDGASSLLTVANDITLSNGTISGLGTVAAGTDITGFGTLSIPISSAGSITASGGTLSVTGTVSGRTLAIANVANSDLKIDGTATSGAIAISTANQTLEIGATGSLTISAAESITNGKIVLGGGTLTDAAGLTIGSGATLSGFGTVGANIAAGTGTITASGGLLNLNGTVASGNAFTIATASASTLKFSGAATVAAPISITSANQTLEAGTGVSLTINGAAQTVTNGKIQLGASSVLTVASDITLSNGTISGLGTLAADTDITGFGTVSIPISSAGTITASGGTLSLAGTVSGRTLAIADVANSDLKIDGTATSGAIAISTANQTLEIGATGSLTITAAESITNGKIVLGGGTLTDAAGITIGSGATLSGKGTVSGPVNGVGTITADGGTLEFMDAVDSTSASSFHIADVAGSVLKFNGTVGTASIHPTITFDGGLGVLDLSSVTLSNFHAIVANFTSGEGIKVAGAADVVLDSSGMFITVYDAAHNSLGTINLSASYAGNEFSVSGGTISVAVDTTTPTGVTPDLAAAFDSGLSSTDDITNVGGLTFNVALNATVAVGDTVQLLLAGAPLAHPVTHTITFADRDAGSVNLAVTAGDLGADGSKSISAGFSDPAGHVSTTSALVITLDTTIATPTVALSNDAGSSNSDHITNNAALTFGAAAADVTRSFSIDGGPSLASYIAPTADGGHTVVVTDTDTAGNTANASISFTLDRTLATPTVSLTSDTGGSNSDHITKSAALTFSAAAADVTRKFTVDGGVPSASYTAPTTDGAHTVVVTDTDIAGNIANASISFTLDNTIATPTVTLTSDTGTSGDQISNSAALTLSAAAADVTRKFTVDGGVPSASYTAPTANGAHTVVVTDTDTAGNTATASISFTLDTTITASIAVNAITADNVLNAAEAGGTVAVTGTVGGDVRSGDIVTLTVNGTTYTGAVSASTFSIDVPGSELAADANQTVDASVSTTDAAGNSTTATAARLYSVRTNPAPVITTFSNDTGIKGDNITADTTLQLSGTADANSRVVIFDGPSQIGIIFADGAGAWNFNTATLAVGFHTFSAVAYDAQNHASPASTPLVIQVDPAAANHAPVASGTTLRYSRMRRSQFRRKFQRLTPTATPSRTISSGTTTRPGRRGR